jgi:hypothetical protein
MHPSSEHHHDIAATSKPVGNYNILLDTFMHSTLGCEYGVRSTGGNGGNGGNGSGRSGRSGGGGSLLTEEEEQGERFITVQYDLPILLSCFMYMYI